MNKQTESARKAISKAMSLPYFTGANTLSVEIYRDAISMIAKGEVGDHESIAVLMKQMLATYTDAIKARAFLVSALALLGATTP